MARATVGEPSRIDQFFAGLSARADRWRNLVELAEAWSSGSGSRVNLESALAEMAPTEEYHAYPGHQLMTALRDRAAENDARATASLARRITRALLTRSFRQNPSDWEAHEDDEGVAADVLPRSKASTCT
jgi:arginine decarboxylase